MAASWPGPSPSGPYVPPPAGRHRLNRTLTVVSTRADSRDLRELHEAGLPATARPMPTPSKARWRLVVLLELMPIGLRALLGAALGAVVVAIVTLLAGSGGGEEPPAPVSTPGLQVVD